MTILEVTTGKYQAECKQILTRDQFTTALEMSSRAQKKLNRLALTCVRLKGRTFEGSKINNLQISGRVTGEQKAMNQFQFPPNRTIMDASIF